ncbi:MAG: efflux transporter outer membrane subunit [Candidatus Andeanibacterium colombiense]|uniref:Efflux transporter outer membrane subunit n=1 Tax=Candidatus Andeanibacterium colombiense TaxID=3121345 RepID=A0AAJ5X8D5_9SPHN|nr:MAG: efflux transporter outer membrane subunit [Sphingomonadaceae bacterium]
MNKLVYALPLTLLSGACSLAPAYVQPELPVAQSWPRGDAYLAQSEAALPSYSYTDVFKDERLRTLVAQALANNRDLRIAAANLAEARAQVRVTRAAQFPQIAVGGSAGTDDSGNQNYALQGGISAFELDLFGKLRNATAVQRDTALASEASARSVRLGLVSDLASAWATYAADKDLLAIAQDTAASAQRSVGLTKLRLDGGVAPRTDLRQAEQVLATAQGDLAQQQAALAEDQNLMRLLVGAEIDPALLPGGLSEVLASVETLPAGTSSDVLLRRPDVVEAEYQLRAANADIGVARAQLFPTISLTGLLGFASDALGSLFTGGAFAATAGADASYAIFDGGAARGNVAISEARKNAALATYEKAIQTAFREVSDALATHGTIADRQKAAAENTEAASDTATLSDARYRGGIDSFLSSLDAQRSLYSARQQEVAITLIAVQNRITLYRVLGGDRELSGAKASGN